MAPYVEEVSAAGFEPVQVYHEVEEYYPRGLHARFLLDSAKPTLKEDLGSTDVTATKYADIGYAVDEQAYRQRSESRLVLGGLERSVPLGFPEHLSGPQVWSKDRFQDESEFVYHLSDADKQEIGNALEYFKSLGLGGEEVSRENFPLPNLSKKLDCVCNDIYDGRGFATVRGLEPETYVVGDRAVVVLGISSYIAERRGRQDQRGSMLMHVIYRNDEELDKQSSEDKPFHTDTVNDCLCLFVESLAASGGRSVLASAWQVYNELAATRPDLIHVLAQPDWPFDTFGRSPPYYKRALMYYHDDKLITSFSRRLLVGHDPHEPRSPGIPGLTEAQAEALDAVHFIARKHEIKPTLQKGDLRFINNMSILHRREAYSNSMSTSRHLIRIWLNNESRCWSLPRDLRLAWARVFDDDDTKERHWDVEPIRKEGKILRVAGSCD